MVLASHKLLVGSHIVFSLAWGALFAMNVISDISSNRSILTGLVCFYLIIMSAGLVIWRRLFSVVSFINFLVVFVAVGFVLVGIQSALNWFLVSMLLASLAGMYVSANSARLKRAL